MHHALEHLQHEHNVMLTSDPMAAKVRKNIDLARLWVHVRVEHAALEQYARTSTIGRVAAR